MKPPTLFAVSANQMTLSTALGNQAMAVMKTSITIAIVAAGIGGSKASTLKPFLDERKQIVLAEHREVRRTTERAYEDCLRRGGVAEKCLATGHEAGQKRLADWRAMGQNPHAFTHY